MEIVIPEYKIERRVRALAHRISEEHKSSGNSLPPVMVCVLNGAFMFFTDLVKDVQRKTNRAKQRLQELKQKFNRILCQSNVG